MKVEGIKKENITIDVEPKELFSALVDYFNMSGIIFPSYDESWIEYKDENGKLISIKQTINCSYHGSDNYIESGMEITDKKGLLIYESLRNLQRNL